MIWIFAISLAWIIFRVCFMKQFLFWDWNEDEFSVEED